MSATRILVLGVVHTHGKAHGYQVRRELLSWRADIWAKVGPGSIYQALRTLTKRGLLEHVATEAGEGGPERTVYRITPDGETEYLHLVRVAVSEWEAGPEALSAAFTFLHLLRRREVTELLGHRAHGLRARLVEFGPSRPVEDGTPPQIEALKELGRAQIQADIDWSVELADRIRGGAFTFADEKANQA